MTIEANYLLRKGMFVRIKEKEEIQRTLLCYNGKGAFIHKKDFHVCWIIALMEKYCGAILEIEKETVKNAWRLKKAPGFWHPDWFDVISGMDSEN